MTPEQRLEAFRKFVERSPDDPFARYSLAMGHRGAGQLEEAVQVFEELARRIPGYVPTYLMWGQTLEALDRVAEAAQVYDRGIAPGDRGEERARGVGAPAGPCAALAAREAEPGSRREGMT